jgi:hypothetical protein
MILKQIIIFHSMKKYMLLILIMTLIQKVTYPQGCLPEGITFTTQAQIDSFQFNYPGCTQIEGNVKIDDTYIDPITNLNGLITLTSVDGNLLIQSNFSLQNLQGLDSLSYIGGNLYISGIPMAVYLSGLEGLKMIGGDLSIVTTNLTSLEGLNNLISVQGDVIIGTNFVLTSLLGMDNLTMVGKDLKIGQNPFLTNLAGLSNISSIGGGLFISGPGGSLFCLTGLENVTSLGGLFIDNTTALTNLTGLENVTTIFGNLRINGNTILTSLTGLENATSIESVLSIFNNPALTSLKGLENITAESISNLYIYNNSSLSACEVQSICNYLIDPNGDSEIHDNAPGCSSPEEVEAACQQVGLENYTEVGICAIFPNPSNGQFTFEFYLQQAAKVNLVVHNSLGQVVATLADGVLVSGPHQVFWNAGNLPEGIYYCRLQAGDKTVSGKIIKIE